MTVTAVPFTKSPKTEAFTLSDERNFVFELLTYNVSAKLSEEKLIKKRVKLKIKSKSGF